jgi:hypothetical protein
VSPRQAGTIDTDVRLLTTTNHGLVDREQKAARSARPLHLLEYGRFLARAEAGDDRNVARKRRFALRVEVVLWLRQSLSILSEAAQR